MGKARTALILVGAVASAIACAVFIISPEKHRITQAVRNESGSRFIELSEGCTEYEIAGPLDGAPVVLIHGMSVPMDDWDYQFRHLVGAGYRVLRYNQYGRGLSDRPRGDYDARRYVGQLADLITAMGWTRVHLVVHSMGAAVAVEYIRAHPDTVDRLVLISPVFDMAEDNAGISMIRIPLFGDLMAKTVLPGILTARAEGLFTGAGVPDAEKRAAAFQNQTRFTGFSRSVKSLFRHDVVDELSQAYERVDGRNTLLLWGTRDESVPERHITAIRKLVPGMETVIFEGIGHSPNLEIPEDINSLVADFLAQG